MLSIGDKIQVQIHNGLKVKGWKKFHYANSKTMEIIIPVNIDFRYKSLLEKEMEILK